MNSTPLTRLAALGGILGPLLFGTAVSGLTIAQYDFMRSLGWHPLTAPTFDWPSGLALGPYGALMTATFIISGILMSTFALGLRAASKISTPGQIGTTLLTLAGLAMAGLSFTTDPTIRTTAATWHGRLHDLSFGLLGLTLLPAMFFLGKAFQSDPLWRRLSRLTWIAVALALPAFVLKGIVFYAFLLVILAWSEIIALHLRHLTCKIR